MHQLASLTTLEDVAWFLASYARDARARIEDAETTALSAIRQALEEAVTAMVRRIAALLLLQPDLDESYRAAKAEGFAWQPGVPVRRLA